MPPSIRIEVLSFLHHQLIAAKPRAEQVQWLQKAVRLGWTVDKMRQALSDEHKTKWQLAYSWAYWAEEGAKQLASNPSGAITRYQIDPRVGKCLRLNIVRDVTEAVHKAALCLAEVDTLNQAYLKQREAHDDYLPEPEEYEVDPTPDVPERVRVVRAG